MRTDGYNNQIWDKNANDGAGGPSSAPLPIIDEDAKFLVLRDGKGVVVPPPSRAEAKL